MVEIHQGVHRGECSKLTLDVTDTSSLLRHRRELRYSREQNALMNDIIQCERGRSVHELKLSALKRIQEELERRETEDRAFVSQVRQKLSDYVGLPEEHTRESLLQSRSLGEHRLAETIKEKELINKEIERLKSMPVQAVTMQEIDDLYPLKESRSDTNLLLFLQKSATKHPLLTYPLPQSVHSLRVDNNQKARFFAMPSSLSSRSSGRNYFHSLADVNHKRNSINERQTGRLQTKRAQATTCSAEEEVISSKSPLSTNGSNNSSVLAIDEFSNSFSSRVIIPTKPRPKHRSSLRNLRTSTKPQRIFFKEANKSRSNGSDFGNVTIIRKTEPKSRIDFTDDLINVPLPDYVQSLLDDFEHANSASLSLNIRDTVSSELLTFREPAPLSPVLEQSFSSTVSTPLSLSPVKSTEKKPFRKRRSIFTLRLPLRPSSSAPEPTLRSSLEINSTSESDLIEVSYSSTPRKILRRRPNGLPSTRNYDLSMLEKAPDDVPETPKTSITRFELPLTPSKIRSSRGMSVLREVGNKFVRLGRR